MVKSLGEEAAKLTAVRVMSTLSPHMNPTNQSDTFESKKPAILPDASKMVDFSK